MPLTRLALALLVLALTACGASRSPTLSYQRASIDDRLLTMRVLKVTNAMDVPEPTSDTSHLIEVEIEAPIERHGERITLPYNEWMVGRQPPRRGEIVMATPKYWIRGDGTSRGKPMHGWNEKRPGWDERFK